MTILTAEDFELLPGVIGIDSPAFEAIADLTPSDFDIAPVAFEAITAVPEIDFAEFEQLWPVVPFIPIESGIGSGHAVPLHELLWFEEPQPVIEDDESDDEECLVLILALAA